MIQTTAVIIIVLLAAAFVAVNVYRFFTGSRSAGCSPDRCASCPYAARPSGCRPGPEKNLKNP